MENLNKLESIVDLYFSKKYKLFKPQDANGDTLGKCFEFESRADFLDAYLQYYRNLPNLDAAIANGCSAKFKILYESQEYELKHIHQEEFKDDKGNLRGVNNTILSSMAVKLRSKSSQLKKAKSFDDVYSIVKATKVSGFGELSIYDAAVRISAYLGFKPTKVFLHAGTRIGASYLEDKELLPEDSSLEETLEIFDFPKPIQKLNAIQLENFLCSFKSDLKKI
ncbi:MULTISPECIES: hypothetical protein [Vibrio]|uniref:Uncharacterized protein n=1 Tax=Vibrio atlanticus TaxID=693153 RepID=A0A1C3J1E7_9VIBR|nr:MULTISPECIES: hypothetical protein [Vibrio]MDH5916633.1 hypothetical protein [Vibrio splendidus]PTP09184.1 hypothetical protein CWN86_05720 [Vibrio splendidus]PTP25653.1 hypothetical protein CWN85_02780 [Vibrio splendidus]SBS67500.1 hypothetical protein VAT7223_03754 [Vibrio atlanticus]